jgi:hypothetical protein
MILLGCIISSSTIIPMGNESTTAPDSSADVSCQIFPWLYSVGFCITFGTLFAKIRRIDKIFAMAAKMKRAIVTITQTLQVIGGLLVIDVLILAIWTADDPLVWTREPLTMDVYGHTLSSAGECVSASSDKYLATIGCLHVFVMAYASYLCYKTRDIPTEFAGGKYVALAMASNLQVFLLGVPVMVIVGNDPSTSFFVRSAIIFLNDFAVVGFILGNVISSFYAANYSKSGGSSDTGFSNTSTGRTEVTKVTQGPQRPNPDTQSVRTYALSSNNARSSNKIEVSGRTNPTSTHPNQVSPVE